MLKSVYKNQRDKVQKLLIKLVKLLLNSSRRNWRCACLRWQRGVIFRGMNTYIRGPSSSGRSREEPQKMLEN